MEVLAFVYDTTVNIPTRSPIPVGALKPIVQLANYDAGEVDVNWPWVVGYALRTVLPFKIGLCQGYSVAREVVDQSLVLWEKKMGPYEALSSRRLMQLCEILRLTYSEDQLARLCKGLAIGEQERLAYAELDWLEVLRNSFEGFSDHPIPEKISFGRDYPIEQDAENAILPREDYGRWRPEAPFDSGNWGLILRDIAMIPRYPLYTITKDCLMWRLQGSSPNVADDFSEEPYMDSMREYGEYVHQAWKNVMLL